MSGLTTSPWWTWRAMLPRFGLLLMAGVVAITLGGVPWLGIWKMAIDWVAGAYVLIGPLSAGLVAWDMSRMRATGWDRAVCSTPLGLRGWLHPVIAMWVIGVTADLVLAAIVTGVTIPLGSVVAVRQLSILVSGAAVYLLQVLIGAFLGTRAPGPWAPPLAVLLVFGLFFLGSVSVVPDLFRTGGVTGALVGQGYNLATLGLYVWFALAAAVLLIWMTLRVVSQWRPAVPVVVLAVGALVAAGVLVEQKPDRYVYVAAPLTCTGSAPAVCLATETRRPLRAVSAELHRLVAPLVAAGAVLPDRWTQSIPGQQPPSDSGVLIFVDAGQGKSTADPQAVLVSVTHPAPCVQLSSPRPPPKVLVAQADLAMWIVVNAGLRGASSSSPRARWFTTPTAAAWAVDTFDKLRTCRLSEIRAARP